jgi:superoxide reductase
MKLLVANATDGDVAKHMPVIERKGSKTTVKVGSSLHPMTKEHRIEWICLTDGKASMVEELTSNDEPVVTFTPEKLAADHLSAYAFCNLHGLWQTDEK